MKILPLIANVAKGAVLTVGAVTALPVLGAAGTITATGLTIASVLGGIAGAYDHLIG